MSAPRNLASGSTSARLRDRRRGLFVSCALGAVLALGGTAREVRAQAFQGTPDVIAGGAIVDRGTPNLDTITVNTPSAVINWTPSDDGPGPGAIDFLPNGNTAIFQNGSGTSNFAVLNRILPDDPTRIVALNGAIISQLRDAQGLVTGPGGTVAFYSPGGLLIGSTATLDVGSLFLSSLDILYQEDGSFIDGSGRIQFRGAENSQSAIITEAGSQIIANATNSYVALVSPQVTHEGSARVNGSIAYVAAESVDLRINDGLFDIDVQTGTTVATPLSHLGTTGGPASTGAGDNQAIFMVAVPKNQAITALLTGTAGFDTATDATIENGVIVLSAGYSVAGVPTTEVLPPVSTEDANFIIAGGTYTSDVQGYASTGFFVQDDGATTSFTGDLRIRGVTNANLASGNGGAVIVGGDVVVSADDDRSLFSDGSSGQAGGANIFAFGTGSIDIAGSATISAVGSGATAPSLGTAGSGTGGSANLTAIDTGSISIGGGLTMNASGLTPNPQLDANPGAGTGGAVSISTSGGEASITVGGATALLAQGTAGRTALDGAIAQTGTGGAVNINASAEGSTIEFLDAVSINVDGEGSSSFGSGDIASGNGNGGSVSVGVDLGTLEVAGSLTAIATGRVLGASGEGTAGATQGGTVQMFANGGDVIVGGATTLAASGIAGGAQGGQTGGTGTGGFVQVSLDGGSIGLTGGFVLVSDGIGGNGNSGGDGFGGNAGLLISSGALNFGSTGIISASGQGGNASVGFGGDGGVGQGRDTYIQAEVGDGIGGTIIGGDVTLNSLGFGGAGGAGDGVEISAGAGGLGAGGLFDGEPGSGGAFVLALADYGNITLGNVTMRAEGTGGVGGAGADGEFGGAGGVATGGTVQAGTRLADGPGDILGGSASFGSLTASANATGGAGGVGDAGQGDGGLAQAGNAFFNAVAVATSVAGDATITAVATGGAGGLGGNAEGGGVYYQALLGGEGSVGGLLSMNGNGAGGAGVTAGSAIGGLATIDADGAGSSASAQSARLTASGAGGSSAAGDGGDGTGGTALLNATDGALISLVATGPQTSDYAAFLTANGAGGVTGGGDGIGGSGFGGEATVIADNGTINLPTSSPLGFVRIIARGEGGNVSVDGGTGGAGTGGTITIGAENGGSFTAGPLLPSSFSQGGTSTDPALQVTGGAGFGGTRALYARSGGTFVASFNGGTAGGSGGEGTGGGDGGAASGGVATLDVDDATMLLSGTSIVLSQNIGGAGAVGGTATSGTATVTVSNGGVLGSTSDIEIALRVGSAGIGGAGSVAGGNGVGGTSTMTVDGASVSLPEIQLTAGGTGGESAAGFGAIGGSGTGGTASFTLGAGGLVTTGVLAIEALGAGGATADPALAFTGGDAVGGSALLTLAGGQLAIDQSLVIDASGTGGGTIESPIAGAGGSGTGGTARATTTGADALLLALGETTISATGAGGSSGPSGPAGGGAGGTAEIVGTAGSITLATTTIDAGATGGSGASAGSGLGGLASLAALGGDVSTGATIIRADGSGGDASGQQSTGGQGRGGTARAYSVAGATLTLASATVSSVGTGGSGAANGGVGSSQGAFVSSGLGALAFDQQGNAFANVTQAGGTTNVTGPLSVEASAVGGDGGTGAGGAGTAGAARIYALGGNLSAGSVSVTSNGQGGAGVTGGAGVGLGANAFAQNGAIAIAGNLTTSARGSGGAGSAGGNGGLGDGGNSFVYALNGASASSFTMGALSVNVDATGGAGGAGLAGTAGGAGGNGLGGQVNVFAQSLNGTLTAAATSVDASGTGGAGGAGGDQPNAVGAAGGRGGDGFGGTSGNIGTASGLGTGTAAGVARFASISADSSGRGGAGGVGGSGATGGAGGAGGTGSGGFGSLVARGGTLEVGSVAIVADGFGGAGGVGGTTGGASGASGLGEGGVAGALFTPRQSSTQGAVVTVGAFTATANGVSPTPENTVFGAIQIEAIDSDVSLGAASFSALGYGTPEATPAFPVIDSYIRATRGVITFDGDLAFTASGSLAFEATGVGRIDVDGALTASVTADDGDDSDDGSIRVRHFNRPGGAATLRAQSMFFSAPSFLADGFFDGDGVYAPPLIQAADAITVLAQGEADLGDIEAGTSIDVRYAELDPNGESGNLLDVSLTGLVTAPVITIEAADIAFFDGDSDEAGPGQLGEAGFTTQVNLIVQPGVRAFIGSAAEGDVEGYRLTQDEAAQIEGDQINFTASAVSDDPTRAADITIGDITLLGSLEEDGSSRITVRSDGIVRVGGNVEYTRAGATDQFGIFATERLEVVWPGGIRISDGDGGLAGVLTLASLNTVIVADADLTARLAADPLFEGRAAALASNSGPVRPEGYLQARGIALLSGDGIYVQNSGTASEFAGLTVGPGGLLIGAFQTGDNPNQPDGPELFAEGDGFSFVGTLTQGNEVLLFDFSIDEASTVQLLTYSYSGGTNIQGTVIEGGNFDPILALFDATGALIGQDDDGGPGFDVFFERLLPAGSYQVSVTQFPNFAVGPNLSDGFEGGADQIFDGPNFAFDVIGADSAEGPGGGTLLDFIGHGRQITEDGTVLINQAAYDEVDFGFDRQITYTDASSYNGIPVNPVTPPPDTPPGTDSSVVLGPVEAGQDSPIDAAEDESGAGGFGDGFVGLISVGGLGSEPVVEEPVASGGDSTLWVDDDDDDDDDGEQP